jgi:LytS/YehU family sensor histidine kinase
MKEDEQVKEQENERLKSELSFLRSQISPHFMFNVLNSVVSLSRRKPEMVEPVVVKLSELMRYMIYETNDSIVPISKELVYLESYIDLQKIRFGDDIQIDFKHELGPKSSHIEPMLLIPFVENAFKHGVGFIENPTIDIELKDSTSELFFRVANKKGTAMNETKDESSGIGLTNVKRRLELLYPTNHQLEVNDTGSDFIITLTIQHL